MRKHFKKISAVICLLGVMAFSFGEIIMAGIEYTLEVQQDNYTESYSALCTGETLVGQTFTTSPSQENISKISIWMARTGSASGTHTINIYATSSGLPTGASLGTATSNLSSKNSTPSLGEFIFSSPVEILSSTVYAFTVSSSASCTPYSSIFSFFRNTSNPYAGGNSIRYIGYWEELSGIDYGFRVYSGIETSSCTPPTSGDWYISEDCYFSEYTQYNGNIYCTNEGSINVYDSSTLVVEKLMCDEGISIQGTGKIIIKDI